VTHLARRLAAAGVRAGDRVASIVRNGASAAMLPLATLRLGATLVPLNVRLTDGELAWQLGDCAARIVVTDAGMLSLAERACVARGDVALLVADDDTRADATAELRLAHPLDHVLAIIYTSGTTGEPKGAMLTVGNFWWSAVGSALNLGTLAGDRWLAALPLFHVGGLSIVTRAAIYGIGAVVHDGFDAEAVNRAIEHDRVTIVSVVAVTLQRMLDAWGERPYPAWLRCVLLGGGPAPRPLLERCAQLGVPVVQTYGLTETTSQLATLAPDDALRKLGSAGKPIYPNALRIVDANDHEVAPGVAGEIVVQGPVVTAGYAGRPEATARALRGGWLHTGDVGMLDDGGYLYVLDRRDDLVITGGENVYPAEVEAALLAHETVAEAAVIGVPDVTWGQRVVAFVRPRDGMPVDASSLIDHCRARLARYKAPSEIHVVHEPLPRTASGKLRRAALRDRYATDR
jgi:O-succinylbenzoic acid--CoA ligase